MIIGTQENFVVVNVFDKSRSITSFLSFSIHTISINTLITFGVSFLRPGFLKKLVGVRFSQPHGINMYIGFVSLDLLDPNIF